MWALLRVLDDDEPHPRRWAWILAASLGVSLLWKSLVGVLFPVGAGVIYLAFTRQLFVRKTWKLLHLFTGLFVILKMDLGTHPQRPIYGLSGRLFCRGRMSFKIIEREQQLSGDNDECDDLYIGEKEGG